MQGVLSDPQTLNRYVYCRNNPHKYTDPNGLWAIQIGYIGTLAAGLLFGALGVCAGGGAGIVISYDLSLGLQVRYYESTGSGAYSGPEEVSAGPEIVWTLSAKSIDDVAGTSLDTTVEVASGLIRGGGGVSVPMNGLQPDPSKQGIIIDFPLPYTGGGMQASVQTLEIITVVATIYKQEVNPYGDPLWEEPQSDIIYTPTPQRYD